MREERERERENVSRRMGTSGVGDEGADGRCRESRIKMPSERVDPKFIPNIILFNFLGNNKRIMISKINK